MSRLESGRAIRRSAGAGLEDRGAPLAPRARKRWPGRQARIAELTAERERLLSAHRGTGRRNAQSLRRPHRRSRRPARRRHRGNPKALGASESLQEGSLMPLVNVMVNGRAYTIACDEGEEEHLRALAGHVDGKVRELLETVGQVGDARLLLMAALLIADEYFEANARLEARARQIAISPDRMTNSTKSSAESRRHRCRHAGSRRKAARRHCRAPRARLDLGLGRVLPRASG